MQNPQISQQNESLILATGSQKISETLGFAGLFQNRSGS
jgi:hypothetical protein